MVLRFVMPWLAALAVTAGVIGWLLAPWVQLAYPAAARALRFGVGCLAIEAVVGFIGTTVSYGFGGGAVAQLLSFTSVLAFAGFWGCVAWAVFAVASAPEEGKS